jgi:hypothetical protein
MGPIDVSIEATQYDNLKSLVQTRVSDPELQKEYIAAFALVAKSLNLTVAQFADLMRQQGDSYEQDVWLAAYLNENRVSNAKLGVTLNLNTPISVLREIRA